MRAAVARSRVVCAVFSAACVTCHAGVAPSETVLAEEVPHTGTETAALVVESGARPSDTIRAIRDAIAVGHDDDARSLAAAATTAATADTSEVAWLEASLTDGSTSVAAWTRVIDAGGPLAPWAHLRRGSGLLSTDPTAALADALAAGAVDFAGRSEAEDLAAIARARLGEDGALDALAARTSTTARRARAELLAASEDASVREEALGLYRTLDAERPSSTLEERIAEVLASLPRARREALEDAPLDVALARAESLASQFRHAESRLAFHRVATRARLAGDLGTRCRADMGEGRAYYRDRDREEAIEILDAMAERCADVAGLDDTRAWGRYWAAKSFANLDRRAEAVERWDALAEELPSHRLADDARVEAARLFLRMEDREHAVERLEAAIALGGDMRGEARFLVAWAARDAGEHEIALGALEASLAEGTGETAEDVRGRAAYWRGRTLADLGREVEASAVLTELATNEPLSYYGQQARTRLRELGEGALPALVDPRAASTVPLTPARAIEPAALARLLALLHVGETSLAARELDALGVDAETDPETGWWAASLYAEAGSTPRAVELARRSLETSLYTDVEHPAWTTRVAIAYPLGFRDLVEAAATEEAIPASLVFAIAREESSFEPTAVSVAHAYGLLQIIRPTATSIARSLDLPSDTTSLTRPDVSVRIGARYLAGLCGRYGDCPALVPPAYNAGQGAVDGWLRLRADLPLDAFIEEIPYGETRRYTRRVLMSRGVYEWLREGTLPALPRDTPRRS